MDKRLEIIRELINQQTDVINLAIDLITTCTNPSDYDRLKLMRFNAELERLDFIRSRMNKVIDEIKEKEHNNE